MEHSKTDIKKLFNAICNEIDNGSSLRKALKDSSVSSRTFYEWVDEDKDMQKRYARACEERAETIFEDILNISDSQEGDEIFIDGVSCVNHDFVSRAKLRVDARKWMLGKLNPTKYGDRIQKDITILPESNIVVQDKETAANLKKLQDDFEND